MKALRETFVALDTDSNGIFAIAEGRDGLAKAWLKEIFGDLQQMMEGVDADCSGAIDCTEFCTALLDRKASVGPQSACSKKWRWGQRHRARGHGCGHDQDVHGIHRHVRSSDR